MEEGQRNRFSKRSKAGSNASRSPDNEPNPRNPCGGTCGSHLTDDDDSIECERCDRWFCTKCSSLSTEEFELFTKVSAAHWYCHHCEMKALEAVKTDQIVEERCKQFLGGTLERLDKLEALGNRWSRVEEMYQQLEADMKDLKATLQQKDDTQQHRSVQDDVLASTVHSLFQECAAEEHEKERRKHNIIIQGMAEFKSEDGKERLYYDTGGVREVLDYLEVDRDVKRVLRLGRRNLDNDARPRPLLVEFSSPESSSDAKRKASKLRFGSNDLKKLYIQQDLTKKERVSRNNLVQEMKRRQSEGDRNWVIRGDKLVRRKELSTRSSLNKEAEDGPPKSPQPFQRE